MDTLKRQLDTERTQKDYNKVAWFYNLWNKIIKDKAKEMQLELSEIL